EILPYDRSSHVTNSRIAVIFHAYYTDIFTKYISYLESFPAGTDIYFTVGSEEKEKLFREMTAELSKKYKITFIPIENTGRDVSALLIGG
ncbi:rhamnan synthesis F family protein, partial [Staphylococcus aureus]|nr:rhamnan synthesis F family protein [Staphylococcus aureus]